jgi:pectin methylesterase-like acyl-CoA thioesterase
MKPRPAVLVLASAAFLASLAPARAGRQGRTKPPGERADIVVAQDGTGDFRAIQSALDAIPRDNKSNRVILIRNGVYREKLYVTASHVSIVGEDRDLTRIEYAELRKVWRETHPNGYGAAVINIADEVTLAPAKARTYEHPSLSGSESVGILGFLMSIPRPSRDVLAAVDAGVGWLREA